MALNIAIDGPSGAGKSTISKLIAKKLGIAYLDTGAMYRGLAYYALTLGIAPDDVPAVLAILDKVDMSVAYEGELQKIYVNGVDVTPHIRENPISMAASTISKIGEVRAKLVSLQQKIAEHTDCVLDGRDICTVVLPNADVKVYMDAKPEVRAKRRLNDLILKGDNSHTFAEILEDIERRDYQDMHRENSPLKVADGARYIDTSEMSIDEVADTVIGLCRR